MSSSAALICSSSAAVLSSSSNSLDAVGVSGVVSSTTGTQLCPVVSSLENSPEARLAQKTAIIVQNILASETASPISEMLALVDQRREELHKTFTDASSVTVSQFPGLRWNMRFLDDVSSKLRERSVIDPQTQVLVRRIKILVSSNASAVAREDSWLIQYEGNSQGHHGEAKGCLHHLILC
jgi:hypothetical protein